jgi:hypothetical protein
MAPQTDALETAPLFTPFQLQIGHGHRFEGSWLELPIVPVRPKLVADAVHFDHRVMAPLTLRLRGGRERAGKPYFLTGSASGQVPGVNYLNAVLPIENDWMTGVLATAWVLPQFWGFVGALDADGGSAAVVDLSAFAPFDPLLVGLRLTFAAFVWDELVNPAGSATPPIDVFVR